MCMCMHAYATVHMWRSEDSLWESVFSFHHTGPQNQTQAASPGSRHIYSLSHLPGIEFTFIV